MKIVVIGGTGLIGAKVVTILREQGHEAHRRRPGWGSTPSPAKDSPSPRRASFVVDVSNSPSFEDQAVLEFFQTSTRNLLAAEAAAGVGHHVALSVVSTERLAESGYFRAKIVQETLIRDSPIPYSIVHATQFFEFIQASPMRPQTAPRSVWLRPIQPMAADDVARAVAKVALGAPVMALLRLQVPTSSGSTIWSGRVSVHATIRAWSSPILTHVLRRRLHVEHPLPGDGALLGETHFADWLSHAAIQQ